MTTGDDDRQLQILSEGSQFDRKISERRADNRRVERSDVVSQEFKNEWEDNQSTANTLIIFILFLFLYFKEGKV